MLARLTRPAARKPVPSFGPDLDRRVRMTARCRDCDRIPKVPGAGETVDTPAGRVQLMHNGVRVEYGGYFGDWMAEIIRRLRGHHEPQEELAFHTILRHCRPGGTVVELGSYWAYYALWFLAAVPGGRAVLVEPDPENLALGRRNFALNNRAGAFVPASVGAMSLPPRAFACERDGQSRAVREVCVDALFAEEGVTRAEVLLADIQGAELAMLAGAARSIRRGAVRFLVVSTHHHTISGDPHTHRKCLDRVRGMGGHVLVEHAVEESFSGDGLIVASFDPADRRLPPIRVSRNDPKKSLFRGA